MSAPTDPAAPQTEDPAAPVIENPAARARRIDRETIEHNLNTAASYSTANNGSGLLSGHPEEVYESHRRFRDVLATAASDLRSGLDRADGYRADDTLPSEARARRIDAALSDAQLKSGKALDSADSALVVLQRSLESDALPTLKPSREGFAREDANRLLAAVDGDPRQRLLEIARRDDDLAALVAGPYGRTVIEAAGIGDPTGEHNRIRSAAAAGQTGSTDPGRRKSAEALAGLGRYRGALDAARVARHNAGATLRRE